MKYRVYIAFILILLTIRCQGQTGLVGGLIVSAPDSTPLISAHIKVAGTSQGSSSDIHGRFSMRIDGYPIELRISHVGYHDIYLHLSSRPKGDLTIVLEAAETQLKGVTISANRIVNLNAGQSLYVFDYQLESKGILLLANCNKSAWDQRLILLSRSGDTLASRSTRKARELRRDPLNNNHLLNDRTAWQIYINLPGIELIYPGDREQYESIMSPIAAGGDGRVIVRQNAFANQVLRYTLYDLESGKSILLREIADEAGLIRLGDRQRLSSMPGFSEADQRFEEMCFYAPLNCPIFIQGDSIVLFNMIDGTIEFYDLNANCKGTVATELDAMEFWDKIILHDRERGDFFAVFRKSGIYSLRLINLKDGSLGPVQQVPELPHIEKLQVEGGKLYFLYQDICGSLKQLYRMDL